MPDYKEKDRISQRLNDYDLRHRIGNTCQRLVGVLEFEEKNMSPENLAIACEEIKKIMKAVEDTTGMKQPEKAR